MPGLRLAIVHRTAYAYSVRAHSTVQSLRLTPRAEAHQRVLQWKISAPGSLVAGRDAHGNLAHTLTHHVLHDEFAVEASGQVEVEALPGGRLAESALGLPALAYLASTPLTRAGEALREVAARRLLRADASGLLDWAEAVRELVRYSPGATHVGTRAEDALALGRGVCQDQAQVFIAGCRVRRIPARYVSGYYASDGGALEAESHAWADVWVDGAWLSLDVTHGRLADSRLCRLAVGRDYDEAAPVRGVRAGGGEESMSVRVNIRATSF